MNERVVEIPYVLAHIPHTGLILDVGCGADAVIAPVIATQDRFYWGIDPVVHATLPLGGRFTCTRIEDFEPEERFDAIIFLSTLEHIGCKAYGQLAYPDGDLGALAAAHRLLKPTGKLIVTVPVGKARDYGWFRQYNPNMVYDLISRESGWDISDFQIWWRDENRYTRNLGSGLDVDKVDYVHGKGAGAVLMLTAGKYVK